jgi:error-prone DNA polymerase
MKYVELHARSAFSFLRGASLPEELMVRAAELKLPTIAVCDRDGFYGSARSHVKGKEYGVAAKVGVELTMEDGSVLPVLVKTREGYRNLSRLITEAKLRGTKTECSVRWDELPRYAEGLFALTGDEEGVLRDPEHSRAAAGLERIVSAFGAENVAVEIQRHLERGEERRNKLLIDLARARKLPIVATNGVVYAEEDSRVVQDVFTCLRHHTHLDAAGRLLSVNAERHLKSAREMSALFADLPEAIENTVRVAGKLEFGLEKLGYEFPKFPVPANHSMDSFLRERALEGARGRYGKVEGEVKTRIERELALIAKLGFSGYFLIVWDLVKYCTDSGILVQGRGSAANSVVCYSLGITACDPVFYNLLFERFLSEGRNPESWPDIDLDLPSGEDRERVIQEVYRRYGKHGAAMTANVITYRGRSTMREIGKTLNLSEDIIDRFSSLYANGDFPHTLGFEDQLRRAGLPADHPRTRAAALLYGRMRGLPRHLGQHSGGMIICQGALSSVVPLENASMPGRVVAQWDKDDCEDLGIIKVDLLGLGMMAAMRDAFQMCEARGHGPKDFGSITKEDPAVYKMLNRADTIGTFQVESRAQMATLPRFKPKNFYDIVMQVAIIRPGPIQGGMLASLMARREGKEKEVYLDERLGDTLKETLQRTHGVPLFQEQLLKIAMDVAGFSGGEAEELRRALSFHRSQEKMDKVCIKLRAALDAREIPRDISEKIVHSIQSFAVYGFPESHAISFAMIAYASCWMKAHRPEEFYCSLLNNQPMGFYSNATLIRDGKEHGVKFRPVSVLYSDWTCTIELDGSIRLGLCMVKGADSGMMKNLPLLREERAFADLEDFRLRVGADKPTLRVLARIGALNGLVEHRRDGLWRVETPLRRSDLPGWSRGETAELPLAPMDERERLEADFAGTGVTTGRHPMALIRDSIPDVWRACDLEGAEAGQIVRIAGQVICRQRPGTAKGIVFVSLEDETGVSNAIVMPQIFEKFRLTITQEAFLSIRGPVENSRGTTIVQVRHVEALDYAQTRLPKSHDFH